jgi:hypothetical protein
MLYDPDLHHRRSIRLQGYDYAQAGAYFVTICVYNRECLLSEIVDGETQLTEIGRIVVKTWDNLLSRFSCIELDMFVAMPNHRRFEPGRSKQRPYAGADRSGVQISVGGGVQPRVGPGRSSVLAA